MGDSARLDGKVVAVTGAGRGIGRDIALLCARQGANVVVNDLGASAEGEGADAGPAEEVAALIRAEGGKAIVNGASVAEPEGAASIIEDAVKQFGRIDGVVNNAGILRDRIFHKMSIVDWKQVIDVHLNGSFYVSKAAAPYFKDQGSGSYVHFTSTSGLIGNFGQANYSAAKAGVNGLTRALSREWAPHGINVNAIAPGYISGTRMTSVQETGGDFGLPEEVIRSVETTIPIGRAGIPEDVAGVCSWLASVDSDYVCGQVIEVHGGMEIIRVAD